jgi:hypothetical protein
MYSASIHVYYTPYPSFFNQTFLSPFAHVIHIAENRWYFVSTLPRGTNMEADADPATPSGPAARACLHPSPLLSTLNVFVLVLDKRAPAAAFRLDVTGRVAEAAITLVFFPCFFFFGCVFGIAECFYACTSDVGKPRASTVARAERLYQQALSMQVWALVKHGGPGSQKCNFRRYFFFHVG